MIPVTYTSTCSCGYHNSQQESLQHGAYLRLIVDIVLLCPDCKKRLAPTVAVSYAPLQSDLTRAEKSQQLIALLAQSPQSEAHRLITDACYLLNTKGGITQTEYEQWCARWLMEAGNFLQNEEQRS